MWFVSKAAKGQVSYDHGPYEDAGYWEAFGYWRRCSASGTSKRGPRRAQMKAFVNAVLLGSFGPRAWHRFML